MPMPLSLIWTFQSAMACRLVEHGTAHAAPSGRGVNFVLALDNRLVRALPKAVRVSGPDMVPLSGGPVRIVISNRLASISCWNNSMGAAYGGGVYIHHLVQCR